MTQEEEIIDIYYTMKPMTYFATFCGLWPHTIRRSSPGVSTAGLLWYFFVFSIYIYVFYRNLDREFWDIFKEIAKSGIQTYGTWMQVLSGLLIGMVSLLIAMCTFRKQWTFFEMMKSVDDGLTNDFAVITPKKIFRMMSYLVIVFLSTFLLLMVLNTYTIYIYVLEIDSFFICVSYLLANFPYFCIILIFYFSNSAIGRRFHHINCILRQLSPHDIPSGTFELCSRNSKNDRLQPTIVLDEIYSIYGGHMKRSFLASPPSYHRHEDIKKEIKKLTAKLENNEENIWTQFMKRDVIEVEELKMTTLRDADSIIEHLTKLLDMHDILLDCVSLQNEILSFQILLIIAQIFVFGVFAYFSLYRTLYNIGSETNILAFSNAFWLLIYIVILFIIMSTATYCVNAGKFTGTCCHKVINKISGYADPRIIEKLSIMSHQLTMRTPNITCGLFSFDWDLMFSIVSATTIYLIFLVQFDVAGNSNNNSNSTQNFNSTQ